MADSNFNINQLQNYILAKKAEYITITQPGYEIFFYSRFNKSSDIITHIAKDSKVPKGPGNVPYMGSEGIIANAYISSNVNRTTDVTYLSSIKVRNCIHDQAGSTAEITLVNPDGFHYFLPTIGSYGKNKTAETGPNSNSSTDYDYSEFSSMDQQRIGIMDTVLIRLKNTRPVGKESTDPTSDVETVFRGCVKGIHRSSSPQGGTILNLRLGDFSEYMRMITALPLGMFSTISLSYTGRGLVANLVKYTNRLYTGDWRFLGSNLPEQMITGFAAQIFGADSNIGTEGGAVSVPDSANGTTAAQEHKDSGAATHHAMAIPPFIFLEGSNLDKDTTSANTAAGIMAGQQAAKDGTASSNDTTGNNAEPNPDDYANRIGEMIMNAKGDWDSICQDNKLLTPATPEDVATVAYYQSAITKSSSNDPVANQHSDDISQATSGIQKAQQWAWMLADVYLDAGLPSFEHEKVWNTAWNVAERAFREVYFDFAPKYQPNEANMPYSTASVPDIKRAISQKVQLHDIHPNIGIIKYRLSPCLRAYQEGNDTSYLWQWVITDDDVLKYETSENSDALYTAVFGFGSSMDKQDLTDKTVEAGMGQSQGLLAFAQSTDATLERRVGYRFMTVHDQNIKTPLLMYFTSYILLIKSQMNMFIAQITIPGNPRYKPGSIIRLAGRNIDYYCAEVIHNWSLSEGYTTSLVLQYGHTSGIAPAALTGGSITDNITANAVCSNRSSVLESYAPKAKTIGGYNLQCVIYALWQYMTCCASTPELLKAAMPEAQKSGINPDPPTKPGGVSFTNRTWAALVFANLGSIPITKNNMDNYTTWMAAEEPPSNWYEYSSKYQTYRNNPQNNSLGTTEKLPDGTGSYPDLTTAAYYAAKNLVAGSQAYGYGAIISALQSDSNMNVFCQAVANSSWSEARYGIAAAGAPAKYLVPGRTYSYFSEIGPPPEVAAPPAGGLNTGAAFIPGVCVKPSPGLQQWPYPVYGPIGMRLDAYKTYNSGVSDADAKKNLTADFGKAMTDSVSYITSLLNKYSDLSKPLPNAGAAGTPGVGVDSKDTFEKVIAAWYSNENIMSLSTDDSTKLPTVISALKTIYATCLSCTGNYGIPTTSPDITSGLGSAYSRRIYNAMLAFKATHSSPGTDRLLLGASYGNECAASVNSILLSAGIPVLGSGVSVPSMISAMPGRGWTTVAASDAVPGDFVILGGDCHVGIYTGNGNMISNSSSQGAFSYEASVSYCESYGEQHADYPAGSQPSYWHHP